MPVRTHPTVEPQRLAQLALAARLVAERARELGAGDGHEWKDAQELGLGDQLLSHCQLALRLDREGAASLCHERPRECDPCMDLRLESARGAACPDAFARCVSCAPEVAQLPVHVRDSRPDRCLGLTHRAARANHTERLLELDERLTHLGGVKALQNISTPAIQYIHYINGTDATTRWGIGHGRGVIFVGTRPPPEPGAPLP